MNRRSLLTALSTTSITVLAGCSNIPFTTDASNNTTDNSTDSDLDGTPDSKDYAPWDAAVQNKTDVLDEYWGSPLTPSDSDTDTDPISSILSRDTPQLTRILTETPETTTRFETYTPTKARLQLNEFDRPNTPHRLLVTAREFPQRKILTTTTSQPLSKQGPLSLTIKFDGGLNSEETIYLTAYIIPDIPPEKLTITDLTYLCETNPFTISTGSTNPVSTQYELDDITGDTYTRTQIEGGYKLQLSGRTNGHNWEVNYAVSRAAYERKRHESRGRSREEYVRYALGSGTGDSFLNIVKKAARDDGFTTREQQAAFAIDLIQSIPYIRDNIGTGFDDYPKFIEETMTDIRGDCEDSTIALAVLLSGLGYDVVLIEFHSHIGVGVAGDHDGSYVMYENERYHYIETTSPGWGIGDIPQELDTSTVKVKAV